MGGYFYEIRTHTTTAALVTDLVSPQHYSNPTYSTEILHLNVTNVADSGSQAFPWRTLASNDRTNIIRSPPGPKTCLNFPTGESQII